MTLAELNALDESTAVRELLRCCGSSRWAAALARARPFEDEAALRRAADAIWTSLDPADWREAFAAHPRIGERGRQLSEWSRDEQAGAADAADRFAALNRAYEARFGRTFIVCASGRTGAELAAALERRLENDPEQELLMAAEEQRKITQLRLGRLLS